MAAELPTTAGDVVAFTRAINGGGAAAMTALPHVAGAVAVRLEDDPSIALAPWVNLELLLSTQPAAMAGVLRMLGFMLVDRVKDAALRVDLGTAVRALLAHGYKLTDSRSIATPAVGFVARTIATDVEASIALLRETLTDDRFDRFGSEELPTLSREIDAVASVAPSFAAEIYNGVYVRQVTESRQTSMGSGRILNLTSNARQDFELARWSLQEYFPKFLAASPVEATRALLAAMAGFVQRQHPISDELTEHTLTVKNADVHLQPDHSHIWAHEAHPQFAQDADALLSRFETFLESADESAVMAAASHAVQHAKLAVIWSRLFMAAAARGGLLADLLVHYAVQPEFVLTPDTRKDAIDLVAKQYDALQDAQRVALETELIDHPFDEFAHPDIAKQGLLRRLFGTIGAQRLATDSARDILARAPADERANLPLFQITSGGFAPSDYYWMDRDTRALPEVDETIVELEAVRKVLHLEVNDKQPIESLDSAIEALTTLKARIDGGTIPDPTLVHRAEGNFAQGLHRLVQGDHIDPNTPVETVELIVKWIEDACAFSNPEVDDETERSFEDSMSWGGPCARLEGAEAALDLCLKRAETYASLDTLIDRMLEDPHPAVRLNAALRLVRIWDLDREGFWKRTSRIVATETNRAVLDHFVAQTLGTLVWHGGARDVADLVLPLIDRFPTADTRNAGIRQHLVQMTLQFWSRFSFQDAAEHVRTWISAAIDNIEEVREAIQWFRNAYTAGLRGGTSDPEQAEERRIAMDLIAKAVRQAAEQLAANPDFDNLSEVQAPRARSAMQIIDTACQQLYFSSGAFKHSNQQAQNPPMTLEGAALFLREVAPTLRDIGEYGGPHTIYYLIQVLEHLIDADPAAVFDLIAFAVLRGGQQSGYHFESMAADLMVKLVGRYLADHKEVFDDPQRRSALVDTLETFVTAGWPSVRRLFYRLPELLQ
jgi:hypothetical protein